MHRDEHVDVDEVSDPSISNQDLRHLNRLSQIAQSNVHQPSGNTRVEDGMYVIDGSKRFSDTPRLLASLTNIIYSLSLKSCSASGTADEWHR